MARADSTYRQVVDTDREQIGEHREHDTTGGDDVSKVFFDIGRLSKDRVAVDIAGAIHSRECTHVRHAVQCEIRINGPSTCNGQA